MSRTSVTIELPQWLDELLDAQRNQPPADDAACMQLAIEISARNLQHATGGPFGALIVEQTSGEIVAAGANLVVGQNLSLAHAEAIAILVAQRRLETFDLAGNPPHQYCLYASGQPCIMCFGILWWSGITRLVYAARAEDIEQITGFREGPLPEAWAKQLEEREGSPAIQVLGDVQREAACDVLRAYAAAGHAVYNPGSTNS